jgi:hypothetical protein
VRRAADQGRPFPVATARLTVVCTLFVSRHLQRARSLLARGCSRWETARRSTASRFYDTTASGTAPALTHSATASGAAADTQRAHRERLNSFPHTRMTRTDIRGTRMISVCISQRGVSEPPVRRDGSGGETGTTGEGGQGQGGREAGRQGGREAGRQ